MRPLIRSMALIVSVVLVSAHAQTTESGSASAKGDKAFRARGLFIGKRADAMRIDVLDARTNALVYPGQPFKQGDALKVAVESNFEGFLYIVDLEFAEGATQESRFLIFPYAGETHNKISPNLRQELPKEGYIEFDAKRGIEVLQVIVSHDAIALLQAVLNSPACSKVENRCEIDKSTSASVALLTGDTQSSAKPAKGGIVEKKPSSGQGANSLRSRDIILSPGKDTDAQSTYVAIPDKGGAEGRLKSGEFFVFEIRLKHN